MDLATARLIWPIDYQTEVALEPNVVYKLNAWIVEPITRARVGAMEIDFINTKKHTQIFYKAYSKASHNLSVSFSLKSIGGFIFRTLKEIPSGFNNTFFSLT